MAGVETMRAENEAAYNVFERSELDYLVYNDPAAYVDLILNGDQKKYLKAVTMYKPFKNR